MSNQRPFRLRMVEANKELEDKERRRALRIKDALGALERNEDFQVILKQILRLSGAAEPSIAVGTASGDISPHLMSYYEGRRGVWLDIRAMLSKQMLQKVEHEDIIDVNEIQTNETP